MGNHLAIHHQPFPVGDAAAVIVELHPARHIFGVAEILDLWWVFIPVRLAGQVAHHQVGADLLVVVGARGVRDHFLHDFIVQPLDAGDGIALLIVGCLAGCVHVVAVGRPGGRRVGDLALEIAQHQVGAVERVVIGARGHAQRVDGRDGVAVGVVSRLLDDVFVRVSAGGIAAAGVLYGGVLDGLDGAVDFVVAVVGHAAGVIHRLDHVPGQVVGRPGAQVLIYLARLIAKIPLLFKGIVRIRNGLADVQPDQVLDHQEGAVLGVVIGANGAGDPLAAHQSPFDAGDGAAVGVVARLAEQVVVEANGAGWRVGVVNAPIAEVARCENRPVGAVVVGAGDAGDSRPIQPFDAGNGVAGRIIDRFMHLVVGRLRLEVHGARVHVWIIRVEVAHRAQHAPGGVVAAPVDLPGWTGHGYQPAQVIVDI